MSSAIGLPSTRRALSAAARQRASPVSSRASASRGPAVFPRLPRSQRLLHCLRRRPAMMVRRSGTSWPNSAVPSWRRSGWAASGWRCWRDSSSCRLASSTWSSATLPSCACDRRSKASAARLAPTTQPSPEISAMPSPTVPMPSGRACRCRRMWRWPSQAMRRFSIMRAAVPTRPSVCGLPRPCSLEMSRMPSSWPVPDRMGAAAQVRKPLRSRKCSPPWISMESISASAVPMALVPRCASCQDAPLARATRSALPRKKGSPQVSTRVPQGPASTTTLWLPRTCSDRYSMTGRECASSAWWRLRSTPSACCSRLSAAPRRPVGRSPCSMQRCHERARRSSTRPLGQRPDSIRL